MGGQGDVIDARSSRTNRIVRHLAFYYVAVVACLCLLVAAASILGFRANIINSASMSPAIHRGDILLSNQPEDSVDPTPGEVLVFDRGDRVIAHRVFAIAGDGRFVTRSDAGSEPDSYHVASDDVLGIGRFAIPYLGLPALWLTENDLGLFALWVAGTAAASMAIAPLLLRRRRSAPAKEDIVHWTGRSRLAALLAGPILISLSVTLPLATASGEYSGSTSNGTNSWTTGIFPSLGLYSFGDSRPAGTEASSLYTPAGQGGSSWSKVAVGVGFTCAIGLDATLWCRGLNNKGQLGDNSTTDNVLTMVAGDPTWSTIDAGTEHVCATKSGGTLWCWGENGYSRLGDGTTTDRWTPTQIGSDTNWRRADAGSNHSCAVKTDGTLWCWGYNGFGQLGDGTTTDRSTPNQVGTDSDWVAVSTEWNHACATKTTGTLWCWGYGGFGRLGSGSTANVSTPTQIGSDSDWNNVAAGYYHSCGTKTDGALWCWGYNVYGQVGDGTTTDRLTPTRIGTDTNWGVAAFAMYSTCVTKSDGTLWCWGYNSIGQVGDGTTTTRYTPTQVGTTTTWSTASDTLAGQNEHLCAIDASGFQWCWGKHITAGMTTSPGYLPAPTQSWNSLDGGTDHSCGIDANRALWCWGGNGYGQLGDGTTSARTAPTRIGVDSDWSTVSAGYYHTCGTKTDGALWCWGYNAFGQVGDGTTSQRYTPTRVGTDTDWSVVGTGSYTSCGVKTGGTLWCWGRNSSGQAGDGTTTDRYSPTQIGTDTNWSTVSPLYRHSCGAKTDGTLWCWGYNAFGQLGDGTTTQRYAPTQVGSSTLWSSVSTGYYHTCGMQTGGSVYCWGYNAYGQIGDGTTTNRSTPTLAAGSYTSVTVGDDFNCAISELGELWCWGRGSSGQLGLGTTTDHTTPQPVPTFGSVGIASAGGDHTLILGAPFSASNYQNLGSAANWIQAETLAEANGDRLLQIDSAAELQFIMQLFWDDKAIYINASDAATEGTFRDGDGEVLTYTNWLTGEPNNGSGIEDYAVIVTSAGEWNDATGSSAPYIFNGSSWVINGSLVIAEFD
ncbi:MAG: lectin-like protein [Acidimicrobiales bacterium]